MALSLIDPKEFRITAAFIIFLVSYAVFALGRLPGTKIDRPAMAVIGAVLMFACGILSPATALESIDFSTLVLLFSMMLIVAGLHLAGFFDWLVGWIVRRLDPKYLLPGVIFSGGILSAFLVNDVVCLFMAPLVLRVAQQMGRSPLPLLLGLATASNIGSAASITGNPQNILIGSLSGIGYIQFLARLGPVALAGLFLDWAILAWITRRSESYDRRIPAETPPNTAPDARLGWPLGVFVLVLIAFFAGVHPPLAAAGGAALMLIGKNIDRQKVFEEVDWSLLVLFTGLFLTVGGAERAGVVDDLLRITRHWNLQQPLVLTVLVAALSNIVSNVPAVMLVKNIVPAMHDPRSAWLLVSLSSTLAGNLTITGSVANMIVVERTRGTLSITFWEYLKVGVPVTLSTLTLGWLWLELVKY